MKIIQTIINVLFGVAAAILVGIFLDIGGNPNYVKSGEVIFGVIVGLWATWKISSIQNKNLTMANLFFINISLWFGITAGFLAGLLGTYLLIFPAFIFAFGHPESTVWPKTASLIFECMLVLLPFILTPFLGKWFLTGSLNYIHKRQNT